MPEFILAIDQGTTSTRSILFTPDLVPVATAQREFPQLYPAPGQVEHDPETIWSTTLATMRAALERAGRSAKEVAALGITNQRETTLIWDRSTGRPIHNAMVWQDRRTAESCALLRREGYEPMISARTGLLLDPYFSATKIAWILDHVEGAREAARAGRLAFGTVDTFLLWRLTGGKAHVTDATNAARTLLFDIGRGKWDAELCELFAVPVQLLPEVRDSAGDFGITDVLGGPVRICSVAGDQQAATVGQGCFAPGMMKSTYGTGCFLLLNTGEEPVASKSRLLTTIAYQLGGKRTYALEGAIFVAGAAVQWLRDALKLISAAPDVNALAARASAATELYLVPAFVGLGAPWWDANARGAIFGLTPQAGAAEISRAALDAVGYQTRDLLEAMRADWSTDASASVLRVDGGMTASEMTMQFLADITGLPVERPAVMETTALGAAYLAGYAADLCPDPAAFARNWRCERRFEPQIEPATRERKWQGWRDAVGRTLREGRRAV